MSRPSSLNRINRNAIKAGLLFLGIVAICSTGLARKPRIDGLYKKPTHTWFTEMTQGRCEAARGTFHTKESACSYEEKNLVTILSDETQIMVAVNVIFGPAELRDFTGVVVSKNENILEVAETTVQENGNAGEIIANGCRLKLEIIKRTVNITAGENCDPNLELASGAAKR